MTLYAKTRKGIEEVRSRSGAVDARTRRALILCNGQMSTDEILAALGNEEAMKALDWLKKENYIAPAGATTAPIMAAVGRFSADLNRLPTKRSPKDVLKARHFMVHTIGHFYGEEGHALLRSQIAETHTRFALKALYPEWAEIMENFDQFPKLKKELFKVL